MSEQVSKGGISGLLVRELVRRFIFRGRVLVPEDVIGIITVKKYFFYIFLTVFVNISFNFGCWTGGAENILVSWLFLKKLMGWKPEVLGLGLIANGSEDC